jgi:polyphosphate kinase
LIDNEIKNAKAGKDAWIILKINNIVDVEMVEKLYTAHNEGVKVRLIVRGICSLAPGVKGLSEHIEAISIVDMFLEHSRIFVFCNDHNEEIYISSADWMPRNLDNRIEVSCPIYDPGIKKEILDVLEIEFNDTHKARIINEDQDNEYLHKGNKMKVRSQVATYEYYKKKEES